MAAYNGAVAYNGATPYNGGSEAPSAVRRMAQAISNRVSTNNYREEEDLYAVKLMLEHYINNYL